MKTVLILSDCQSNGNNCLAHEVTNEDAPCTWSLRFHKQFQQVFKWYLKHRKLNGAKDKMPTESLESAVWDYYWEQEGKVAWPSLLKVPNVVNMSVNGGHFIGHHKRLNKYIAEHGKPDHVILTDYTFSHIAHSFKWEGKRYVFERENYVDSEWNSEDYPKEVHLKRLQGIQRMKSMSREWHIRRHKRSFSLLTKVLNYHMIPFTVVRFGDRDDINIEAFDTFMGREVDCIPFFKQYSSIDGEDSKKKLEVQPLIANKIEDYLEGLQRR